MRLEAVRLPAVRLAAVRCAAVCALSTAAVALAACTPRMPDASQQPAATPPATTPALGALRRVPIGLCEDYPEESRSLEGVRQDFELMRRLGIDTLRVSLGWDAIEPERDRYDLGFWDAFVDLAVREYRLTLIPYVAYTPAWNSDGGGSDYWKTPPREPAEFAELMALLAGRYRDRIRSWELWNEPDNTDYWLGTVQDYAELALPAAAAIEAVDPGLSVVSGGLAGHVEFLAELFDRFDAGRAFDVVNLHAYYETWNPEPLETLPRYVAEVSDIVRRHGAHPAIWMAEIGYGNYRHGRHVSAHTSAVFAHEHTPEYQAVALVRSLALLLASPVSLVAWYELKDPPASDAMIGDVNNRHLGVADAERRPKPAAAALASFVRRFANGFVVVTDRLHIESAPSARQSIALAFSTPRDTLVIVAWLATPPPSDQPASARGDAVDARREVLRVTGPYRVRGPAVFVDAVGRERPSPGAQGPTGAQLDLSLELTGGDIALVEIPIERD